MIKIDFRQYVRDRMWFGVYYDPCTAIFVNSTRIQKSKWVYSDWWTLRLWPCLHNDQVVPNWYMAIFNYFGYASDYEEGLDRYQ